MFVDVTMKQVQKTSAVSRTSISRGFNTLGLISTYVQWVWVVIVCTPSLLASNLLTRDTPTDGSATQESIANSLVESLGPFQAIVGIMIFVIACLFVGFAIKRSSGVMTESTEKVLDSTTDYIMPTITHGKKVSKNKQRQLSVRIKFLIKCSLSLLAFLVLPFTVLLPVRTIDMSLVITIGLILLPWSLIWFMLSHVTSLQAIKPRG